LTRRNWTIIAAPHPLAWHRPGEVNIMTNIATRTFVLSCAAFGALAIAAPNFAAADPRVGVTSATSGDPRGKPPAAAERVLHVGVDVQANEVITTDSDDRAHLLFLDGSSLTVGPQARLTIDKFVYDPNTKVGTLAVSVTHGVFRFVGGKISKTSPVVIKSPSATLSIRGGIMIGNVEATKTTATFVFGIEMTVAGQGQTRVVTRPGWQVTTFAGKTPSQAVQLPPGALSNEMGQLEADKSQQGTGNADKKLEASGFSDKNSGRKPTEGPGSGMPPLGGTISNALSDANTATQAPTIQAKPPQPIQPPVQPPAPPIQPPTGGPGR
jgi:hypothetical protein